MIAQNAEIDAEQMVRGLSIVSSPKYDGSIESVFCNTMVYDSDSDKIIACGPPRFPPSRLADSKKIEDVIRSKSGRCDFILSPKGDLYTLFSYKGVDYTINEEGKISPLNNKTHVHIDVILIYSSLSARFKEKYSIVVRRDEINEKNYIEHIFDKETQVFKDVRTITSGEFRDSFMYDISGQKQATYFVKRNLKSLYTVDTCKQEASNAKSTSLFLMYSGDILQYGFWAVKGDHYPELTTREESEIIKIEKEEDFLYFLVKRKYRLKILEKLTKGIRDQKSNLYKNLMRKKSSKNIAKTLIPPHIFVDGLPPQWAIDEVENARKAIKGI